MAFNWQTEYHRYRRYFINIGQFYQQKRARVYTEIVLTIITITFFLFFAIKPTLVIVAGLIKTIDDQKVVNAKLEEKINNLNLAQNQYQSVEGSFPLIEESLPNNPSVSTLIKELEALTRRHGLSIGTIQYGQATLKGEQSGGKIMELTFTMSVSGTYSNLKLFLQSLSSLRRIIDINSFSFKSSKLESNTLSLGLNAKTYYLKEEK